MPMTENLRVTLNHTVEDLRGPVGKLGSDWSKAEINAATRTLATDLRHPRDLWLQAVAQAFNLGNERAISLTRPIVSEAVIRALPARDVVESVWCATHETRTRLRPDGQRACCWTETAPPAPFVRTGTSTPPPGLRALIEQDIQDKKAVK